MKHAKVNHSNDFQLLATPLSQLSLNQSLCDLKDNNLCKSLAKNCLAAGTGDDNDDSLDNCQ